MDPNITYKKIYNLVSLYKKGEQIDLNKLDELLDSIYTWINCNGFAPKNINNNILDYALNILAKEHSAYSEFKDDDCFGLGYNQTVKIK